MFDFDGLLIDTETSVYRAWAEAYHERGLDLDLRRWAASIGTIGGFDPVADIEARSGKAFGGDDAARRLLLRMALVRDEPLRPGVAGLIGELDRRGLTRAIVSSSDVEWVTGHLARLGIPQGWGSIRCADGDVSVAKPAPSLYLSALQDLDLGPSEAMALEDSPNGIAAARAAGIFCVAVPNDVTRALDLSQADALVPSLSSIQLDGLLAMVP